MAQVTYGTPVAQRHIIGDLVLKFFVVNGASGSTLPTGMLQLFWYDAMSSPQAGGSSVITGIANANGLLTITSSGTMVNEIIMVIGREG